MTASRYGSSVRSENCSSLVAPEPLKPRDSSSFKSLPSTSSCGEMQYLLKQACLVSPSRQCHCLKVTLQSRFQHGVNKSY